jgi:7,8-dihydropterin-6-yl-methyl-4-(beta-D-ribofuranosyl)aminobenzene 5'-phosphate synthase
VLDRPAIERSPVRITIAQGPALVADHAFATGQVSQVTFEKLLSPRKMTIGVKQGLGCYPERLPEDERNASIIPDQFRHEIATVYNLKGRGLVILTSCSHRGVVNIIQQAGPYPASPRSMPSSAAFTSRRIRRIICNAWSPI